jgi:hypothetical protein
MCFSVVLQSRWQKAADQIKSNQIKSNPHPAKALKPSSTALQQSNVLCNIIAAHLLPFP